MTQDVSNSSRQYDVLIMGGGIYGACMAWEAASRGLNTGLFEKGDYASATSANSMKIIHGGLRYLQKLDLRRCRHSSLERRSFLKIAPHLVEPLSCVMPTYPGLSKSRYALSLGLALNDIITFDRNRGLSAQQSISAGMTRNQAFCESLFHKFNIGTTTGCALWQDGQTLNSERLVLAFVQSAQKAGADMQNYTQVTQIDGQNIVHYQDKITQKTDQCSAQVIIDCTGPWDNFKHQFFPEEPKQEYCKAINLLVKQEYSPHALGMKTRRVGEESRLLFFTPWLGQTLIGTWYFDCDKTIEQADPTKQEMQSCVQDIQSLLPEFTPDDIVLSHAGFLPVRPGSQAPSQRLLERGQILKKSFGEQSYIRVTGVKYTMARKLAQSCIDDLHSQFPQLRSSRTASTPLVGGDSPMDSDGPWSEQQMQRLYHLYGSQIEKILQHLKQNEGLTELIPGSPVVSYAELNYVLENEQVKTLNDLLVRRLGLGSMEKLNAETVSYCCKTLAQHLAWTEQRQAEEIHAYEKIYSTSMKIS